MRRVKTRRPVPASTYLIGLTLTAFLANGCGAPGEPLPPSPPIPTAITDLAAQQAGSRVALTFTMPGKSTLGDRLPDVPTVEILRGSPLPGGSLDAKSFRVVDTIPGALVSNYVVKGQVAFPDPITEDELRKNPGEIIFYRVRTRVSTKKVSGDSNDVKLKVYPVPSPIEQLTATLTKDGIHLNWSAPPELIVDESVLRIEEYHVYRGELAVESSSASIKNQSQADWTVPLLQISLVQGTEYQDTGFDYKKTYAYVVRSVVKTAGGLLESSDSNQIVLTPIDTFPPESPKNVVAAVLPGGSTGKFVVELSWSINSETDLAGYRVYRSEQEGAQGQLITKELLSTPEYRDNLVQSDQHFWYIITAVDVAGNESERSTAAEAVVP